MSLEQETNTGYALLRTETIDGFVKKHHCPECPIDIEWPEIDYDSSIPPENLITIPRIGRGVIGVYHLLVRTNNPHELKLEKPAGIIYEQTLDGVITEVDDSGAVMHIGKEAMVVEQKELLYNVKRGDLVRGVEYIALASKNDDLYRRAFRSAIEDLDTTLRKGEVKVIHLKGGDAMYL